jgi:hypothetical protein
MKQAYGRIGSTLTVLNLTDAIGNEHPQIIFEVGVDRKENYAGGYCLPVSYFR